MTFLSVVGSGLWWWQVGSVLSFSPGLRLERTADGGLRTCGGTARPRFKRTSQEAAIVCGMQASCHHLVLLERASERENYRWSK